jgi:hypothetical protein
MGVSLTPVNINELCLHFKKPSMLDLYYGVAVGSIDLRNKKHLR